MKRLFITRTASKELHAIWEYIAADNLDQADRVVVVVESEMHKLCE